MTDKLKAYIAITAFAFICIIGGFIIYSGHQAEKYRIARAEAARLADEYKALVKSSDTAIIAKDAEIAKATTERDKAIADAAQSKQHDAVITAKYDALKGEVAALPGNALSGKINAFIGNNEIVPTVGGYFTLQRTGAERTLTLFYDGAEYRAKYENGIVTIASLEAAVSAGATLAKSWEEKYMLRDGEYVALGAVYAKQSLALKYLERSIAGRRLKSFIIGSVFGGIVGAIIYHNVKQ